MDVKLKVQSMLVLWAKRYVTSSSRSVFLSFWFHSVFNSSPVDVFSCPFAFSPRPLPSFYQSLLLAWHAVDGSFSSSRSALVMSSSDPHQLALASNITAKSAYLYLLSVIFAPPHCEQKFLPVFGTLYWSATWRQLHFFFILIGLLSISPGRLLVGFSTLLTASSRLGILMILIAFVALLMRLPLICFLDVLSLLAYCPGCSPLCFVFLLGVLLFLVDIFCLVSLPLSFVLFLVFSSISSVC